MFHALNTSFKQFDVLSTKWSVNRDSYLKYSNEKTYSYVINIIKDADIGYDDNCSQMKALLLFSSMKMGHIIKNSVNTYF